MVSASTSRALPFTLSPTDASLVGEPSLNDEVQAGSQARPLMSLTIQTCICVVLKDATDLRALVDLILKIGTNLTFFLLQATHALGARNGGGLNLSISRERMFDQQLQCRLLCGL